MAWVKIDDEFYDHPKWAGAPGDSIALWLAMLAWCNRNDSIEGFIPAFKTGGLVNVRNVKTTLADLCSRDVIHAHADGYVIHDYVEYQQPEKVKAIAAKKSEAGKAGAAKRWAGHIAKSKATAMAGEMADAIAEEWPDPDPRSTTSSLTTHRHLDVPRGRRDDYIAAINLIVEQRCEGREMDDPRAYKFTVARGVEAVDGIRLVQMLTKGMSAVEAADAVVGAPALKNAPKQPVPWCGPECPTCGGDAWIETETGMAPCPDRKAVA